MLPVREVVEGSGDDGSGAPVWVVEDWVDGRELRDVILTDGPLTAEQSVAIGCGVLRGLAAVQERGVVHGDVSPTTIVLGAGGVPQLVGFGFAGLPGRPPADAGTDVDGVVTILRDLLAGAPTTARHKSLDKTLERATSAKARRGAAELLAALEKAARSDFGRRWDRQVALAPLAAARPPGPARSPDARNDHTAARGGDAGATGRGGPDAVDPDAVARRRPSPSRSPRRRRPSPTRSPRRRRPLPTRSPRRRRPLPTRSPGAAPSPSRSEPCQRPSPTSYAAPRRRTRWGSATPCRRAARRGAAGRPRTLCGRAGDG